MKNIKVGEVYTHRKGGMYTILHIAYDANNTKQDNALKSVIVYRAEKDQTVWVRDINEFLEVLEDGNKRFTLIE